MRTVIEKILQKQEKRKIANRIQKSQLVMSFLTLIVCVGVLCTGSWAYFTDSATVFVAEIYKAAEPTSQLLELELQTTVAYMLDEPELIEAEENGVDSEEVIGEPQEIIKELPENAFTAPQDGKYQFTMVFSGNTAGYGKITVTDGKETDGTEKIYVTEAVTPSETDSVEYSVVFQLAEGCVVSFEVCLGELPEDTEAMENDTEILFSDLEQEPDNSNDSENIPTDGESQQTPETEEPVLDDGEETLQLQNEYEE